VDLLARILPTGEKTDVFRAVYSALKYYDNRDDLFLFSRGADVVVNMGNNPVKFVFWRGGQLHSDDRQRAKSMV